MKIIETKQVFNKDILHSYVNVVFVDYCNVMLKGIVVLVLDSITTIQLQKIPFETLSKFHGITKYSELDKTDNTLLLDIKDIENNIIKIELA